MLRLAFILILCNVIKANQLLLVSMDGFRWDYLKMFNIPNFARLAKSGTKTEYLNNVFPTETHPNHYSIVTGLFPESHGVVGNDMYDPLFDETFNFYTTESKWWDAAEPIWVTLRRKGRSCGSVSWPGAEVEIHGYRPNLFIPYNETITDKYRIDKAIRWLSVWHFDFVALYFPQPDMTGHGYGPLSPEMRKTVENLDRSLGYLLYYFDSLHLWSKVNVIVTSDHGMTSVDMKNSVVDLSDYVDVGLIERSIGEGPYIHIKPEDNKLDEVLISLRQAPHITAFKKKDLPERWHFKHNRRVFPVFLLAEEGWSIGLNRTVAVAISDSVKGNHGYDNTLPSMKPIFLASGPNITVNYEAPIFQTIDIYPMMCKLLGIQPQPNNGSLVVTSSFITDDKQQGVSHIVGPASG